MLYQFKDNPHWPFGRLRTPVKPARSGPPADTPAAPFVALVALALFVSLLIGASPAWATGGYVPPKPTPTPTQQGSSATSTSGADASAVGTAYGGAGGSAAGGAGGAGGSGGAGGMGGSASLNGTTGGTAGATLNDSSSASYRNLQLWLPSPLNVPQLTPATAACALSESSGMAFGWNFYSQTSARQTIDGLCIAERQAAALEAQCKFRTAAALRAVIAREVAKSIPGFAEFMESAQATPWVNERDLSLQECSAPPKVEREVVYVDRPAPAPVAPVTVNVAPAPVAQAPAAPATRTVVKRVYCNPCTAPQPPLLGCTPGPASPRSACDAQAR